LKIKLIYLCETHQDPDHAIEALHFTANSGLLSLKRLKRNKLAIKDIIARLKDKLTPDIIA